MTFSNSRAVCFHRIGTRKGSGMRTSPCSVRTVDGNMDGRGAHLMGVGTFQRKTLTSVKKLPQ